MINAYAEIINYDGDEWEDHLDRIFLLDIFSGVIQAYPNVNTLKVVIKYIVSAYSVDSDKIVLGMNWEENKKKIFDSVYAKPEKDLLDQLVYFSHPAVLYSVHKWLEWQNNDTFKNLQTLKDLKIEMQLSCNSKILKANGEVDYDQKFKNAEYVKDLTKMIKDLESELIQNNPKLKEATREMSKQRPEKNSRSVASYAID